MISSGKNGDEKNKYNNEENVSKKKVISEISQVLASGLILSMSFVVVSTKIGINDEKNMAGTNRYNLDRRKKRNNNISCAEK